MTNTTYTTITAEALDRARACARGCYQRALLAGREAWSGGTLTGRARSYGARYASSRRALRERLVAAGLRVVETRGAHGRREVTISCA